jgi:hypothetical protein
MIRTVQAAAILTSPVVPRYERTERTDALRTPRAQGLGSEAFGGGFAQGLGQASGDVLNALRQERQKADRTAAIASRTALDQAEVDLLYDPEQGALAKRGRDSFGLPEPTLQTFDERAAEIERGLTTAEQKETFRLLAGQRRVQVDKQLQRHVASEMRSYAAETTKASLEGTLNNVARHYQDPERIDQERKFGLAVLMSEADNQGLPPEVVKLKADTWESMVHQAVIDKLAIDSPQRAKDYFEANRDLLLPGQAATVERTLKPLVEAQQGQEVAGEIFYADESTSLAEMLKQVRDRFPDDPGVVKAASSEIRGLYSAREEAQRQAVDEAEKEVYAAIAQAKLAGRTPRRGDVPRDAWAQLARVSPESVDKITSALESGQQSRSNRPDNEQLTTWGLLKTDPEALTATNLDALLVEGKITQSHYSDLLTDQVAIRQGKGEKEFTILSNKAAVDTVLKAVGISQTKQPERYAKFYEAMNRRLKLFETENGKPPKQEEVTTMARGLLTEVSQDVSFWPIDRSVPAFEADVGTVRVPAADKAAIAMALQANGLPVTEETISRLYLELKSR